jgi:hypothetical protein
LPGGAGGGLIEGVGGGTKPVTISSSLAFNIWSVRSSPVGVEEQEGEEEGLEDIVRKSTMMIVRRQEVLDSSVLPSKHHSRTVVSWHSAWALSTQPGHLFSSVRTQCLVLLQFSSEPQFECELFRTGLKFSSRFKGFVELNQKFSSGFRQGEGKVNPFKPVQTCSN